MTSAIIVVVGLYLIIGIALTVGVFGNLPILIEGPADLAKLVLGWPLVLAEVISPIAAMAAVLFYLAVAWPLYWRMIGV